VVTRIAHRGRVGLAGCACVAVAVGGAVAAAAAVHQPEVRTISDSATPDALAMSPDGRTLYVGDLNVPLANGLVWPLNLATGQRGRSIRVSGPAFSLAITADGRTLFATDGNTITPIDLAAGRTMAPIQMGLPPDAAAAQLLVSPDGRTLYFPGDARIRRYDLATRRFDQDIRATYPWNLLLSRDDKTLWYTAGNKVEAVSLATRAVKASITFKADPTALAMAPDDRTLWVAVPGNDHRPAAVVPVNVAKDTVGEPIRIADPVALRMAPNGRTLYVLASPPGSDGDGPTVPGWVTPVTLATRKAGRSIPVGYDPTAIVITSNGKTLYVANEDSETISVIQVKA
jgi:DNA-binding beta-propeller fold protein YncE